MNFVLKQPIRDIIYVDDDKDMLSLIKVVLEQDSDITVKTFTSPLQALAEIQNSPPDMIILDYQIPEMRGTEIMEKIQQMKLDIPITFFTAQSAPEEIEKIKAKGANKVIIKPIDITQLHAQLSVSKRQFGI